MKYIAVFEKANDGSIWSWIPEFGAYGVGDTIEEAERSLMEGVRTWIEAEHEEGHDIPAPSIVTTKSVEVMVA
ncbi:MAG: type II toxin-antitoxin system HicB family antitoxin [Candidatus Eremiobacteraeota bacterium]|nr:type II toxin-antitoxin system HicB family antitoxin [Candidatus Eremiobacteraeota bacterium]